MPDTTLDLCMIISSHSTIRAIGGEKLNGLMTCSLRKFLTAKERSRKAGGYDPTPFSLREMQQKSIVLGEPATLEEELLVHSSPVSNCADLRQIHPLNLLFQSSYMYLDLRILS